LDGARWLRRRGFDRTPNSDRLMDLVAHHSAAAVEAEERGLREQLVTEFGCEQSATADALWYCDMTTGPDGQDFEVSQRLDEIRARYGPGHVVTRFIDRATPQLVGAVQRTLDRYSAR
jgi:hypothetical protein